MSKTIFITGSTDGIGKLAASKLAHAGCHLILHGRNREKLDRVIQEIMMNSDNTNISGYIADFSKLQDVRDMASKIKEDISVIDVLVNNAGILKTAHPITENGLDVRIVVNYLAPYQLTNELLPLLENSKSSRIINLSSAAQASVSTQILQKGFTFSDNEAYAQSKLAILLWSFYFAENHPQITTIALNPGSLLNTKMVQEFYGKSWSSADKGADVIIDLAINPKYSDSSGKYFDNDRGGFARAHSDAYDSAIIIELISRTKTALN